MSMNAPGPAGPRGAHIGLRWEVVTNHFNGDTFRAALTITNHGEERLPGAGWAIYFNSCRKPMPGSETGGVVIEHVNGDLFKLVPGPHFGSLAPGVSREIGYVGNLWSVLETDAPAGFFIVFGEGGPDARAEAIGDPEIVPFTRPEQVTRTPADRVPPATPARVFEGNAGLSLLPETAVGKVTPAPLEASYGASAFAIDGSTLLVHEPALAREVHWLRASLARLMTKPLQLAATSTAKAIRLRVDPKLEVPEGGIAEQAYHLRVDDGGVDIAARSAEGVFYGLQTLLQLVPIDAWHGARASLSIPFCDVRDAPRFRYRGLHLDVARNFSDKRTVLDVLDWMALYKLNKLHFHLTDDEGWRVPIASLPELTELGSKRGFSPGERDCLWPSFGSGPDPRDAPGSGHYSRDDFVEILRHAAERHIEVIPEIDLPGHARAAIKAMQARHARLSARGQHDEAEAYRLVDLNDASKYESVQMWKDNVVCIALESCYTFIETVVRDVKALFEEAGVRLATLHVGGDEVPHGAWEQSPVCKAFMREQRMTKRSELEAYFFARVRDILARHGIAMAGWEEVAVVDEKQGDATVARPNPKLAGSGLRPYVWNNVWGWGREDLAYRLANGGYEVVLCNVTNLYFDLAQAKDPEEPGYYWGGFLDTRTVFDFCPDDIYTLATVDLLGNSLHPAKVAEMQRLTPEGAKRVLGMQGHLWGETVRTRSRLEYLLMPRVIALAERAWAKDPSWTFITDPSERRSKMDRDWNEFANRLGQRELPRLDGTVGYRIPVPGVKVEGGVLAANISLPGVTLRYTLDGSEPTASSARYEAPITLPPDAKPRVAAFVAAGRRGRPAAGSR
jgi:hexosaminidase